MNKPPASSRTRRLATTLCIAVIATTIAALLWIKKPEDTAQTGVDAGKSGWLTQLWSRAKTGPSAAKPEAGQPERLGPIAAGLRLVAAFPYPDDNTQSRAAIGVGDAPAEVFGPGDLVAGEYVLELVQREHVTLDKKGQTFHLYREYTPEELEERRLREQEIAEQRARKMAGNPSQPSGPPKPVTLEDGRIYTPVVGGPDLVTDPKTGKTMTWAEAQAAGETGATTTEEPAEPDSTDAEFDQWWKENLPEDMQGQVPEEDMADQAP